MSYPLLDKAPKDHNSDEFLQFLRENNVVVWENPQWLVIENCKYHSAEAPWLTAFHKPTPVRNLEWWSDIDVLDIKFGWEGWDMLIKSPERRTVQRFHVHLTKST